MNPQDPTAPETRRVEVAAEPVPVEAVARKQAAATQQADPTPGAVAPASAAPEAPAGPMRLASGRYRSRGSDYDLELRVDVDGRIPLNCISGDFFRVSSATSFYVGSFVVNSPTLRVTATEIEIEGVGVYTWTAGYPKLRVAIARLPVSGAENQCACAASVQFMALQGGPGEKYSCFFESPFFRTVDYEQDAIEGVTPFDCYDTSKLDSPEPRRSLSVITAYGEAGIEFLSSGQCNRIASPNPENAWSSAELHDAMLKWFSLHSDDPQWKVWLLAATRHERGDHVRGIMFDQRGKQRQGCAVFHAALGSDTPDALRGQLRTYVHELGHCFNLPHPWEAPRGMPPLPSRPNALSYMNYPHQFQPRGDPDFWPVFPFSFDLDELMHLRHGFRNNVIMGGEDFQTGARDEVEAGFDAPIADESPIELRLESPKTFACGEPVVIEIRLSTANPEGSRVHRRIHPSYGFVQIGIRLPSGRLRRYEPLMHHCAEGDLITITPDQPEYESAYIGYGRGGFYFDETGVYQVRAVYRTLDGSQIVSNVCNFRIRTPLSTDDEAVADNFFGESQGTLLYLLGSRSGSLHGGVEAFEEVVERFPAHRLAAYASMITGWNLRRNFKSVDLHTPAPAGDSLVSGEVRAAPAKLNDSVRLLAHAADSAKTHRQIDNITLQMIMTGLAQTRKQQGDQEGADTTLSDMVATFKNRKLKEPVIQLIRDMAAEALDAL